MLLRRKTLALASAFACMLVGAGVSLTQVASAAGTLTGNAQTVSGTGAPISSGMQTSTFQVLTKPAGGKCSGTSASNGVFVDSFITPNSVDVTTLQFTPNGPQDPANPSGPTFPLIDTTGSPWYGANTQADGSVTVSPPLNFAVFDPTTLPTGDYKYGMACVDSNGPHEMFVGAIHINADLSWSLNPDPVIPEFPYAIVLPLTATAIIAGAGLFEWRRRRNSHATVAA
jgi:hypothetical protein